MAPMDMSIYLSGSSVALLVLVLAFLVLSVGMVIVGSWAHRVFFSGKGRS